MQSRLPFYYGWMIVAVVFVTMAIGVNARTAFSLLFPPILDEFGWERAVIAGAFSFGFFVSVFLSPMLGRVVDRHGPLVMIEAGVAAIGAGLLLAAHLSQPWHLYLTLGLMVGGGSVCLGYTGQGLYLPNWFVRRRGFAIGIAYAGAGIGSMIVLPAMQAMIVGVGWRSACTVLGLVVLGVLVPLNLLVRKRPEDLGLAPDGDATAGPASVARRPDNVVDRAWVATDWTLERAVRTPRFWWLATAYFCAMMAWYTVQVHQTRYLIECGFSPLYASWALGFVSFAGIPGGIVLGHVSDRIGREWVWTIANAGFALCYVALLLMRSHPSPAVLWAMVLVQGFLGYGLTPVYSAVPAELFQGRQLGRIFGTLAGIAIAGGALGPWLAGAIHDRSGSYAGGFAVCFAASLIGIACMWIAAPRKVRVVAGRVGR